MSTTRNLRYYDMHGELNHGFLHPGGRHATEKLLSLLPRLREKSIILEIGCGTGETARLIIERFPYSYIGIDASPSMLSKAKSTLGRYNERVSFIECDLQVDLLPILTESIDVIIAESVIAILSPQKIFQECHCVLKRGGILAWNDRLWGNAVSAEECLKVNQVCKKHFGFPAAPEDLPTAADWIKLVEGVGYKVVKSERLTRIGHTDLEGRKAEVSKFLKLRKLIAHPQFFRSWYYDRAVQHKYMHLWGKMESWIFVAQKG